MARVKGAMMTRKRRNKILKMAKGYWGSKSKHFRVANQAVMKSLSYAYTGRRLKKRDFRSLWITRISAACKLNGMNYSTFMHGLKTAGIEINRKMLSEMAINDPVAFTKLVEIKEVRMSPGIDVGDFNTKLKNAQKFIADGNRVKVSVRFRGREMAHTDIGRDLLVRFAESVAEVANLDKEPKMEGRSMSIFLSPKAGK